MQYMLKRNHKLIWGPNIKLQSNPKSDWRGPTAWGLISISALYPFIHKVIPYTRTCTVYLNQSTVNNYAQSNFKFYGEKLSVKWCLSVWTVLTLASVCFFLTFFCEMKVSLFLQYISSMKKYCHLVVAFYTDCLQPAKNIGSLLSHDLAIMENKLVYNNDFVVSSSWKLIVWKTKL